MDWKTEKQRAGFTIVELLTIMSIIVILISLLLPALNRVRRYSQNVRQNAQFHAIDTGLEMFRAENDGYPPSSEGTDGYGGAMKLAEAMVGQDLMGYHKASDFSFNNVQSGGLYDTANMSDADRQRNLRQRQGNYVELENANAFRMKNIYEQPGNLSEVYVLCDVYTNVQVLDPDDEDLGGRTGMPILYYRASRRGETHPLQAGQINSNTDIYNWMDNERIVELEIPHMPNENHFMSETSGEQDSGPINFYDLIRNRNIPHNNNPQQARPNRRDTYILHSAGYDGVYGTEEDVFNFRRR